MIALSELVLADDPFEREEQFSQLLQQRYSNWVQGLNQLINQLRPMSPRTLPVPPVLDKPEGA